MCHVAWVSFSLSRAASGVQQLSSATMAQEERSQDAVGLLLCRELLRGTLRPPKGRAAAVPTMPVHPDTLQLFGLHQYDGCVWGWSQTAQ